MIKDEKKIKQVKIVIFNGISAILIVLFWFMCYYFFENYGDSIFFQKESWDVRLGGIEWLNIWAFSLVYFLIELVNYRFTALPLNYYVFIHAILDFAVFFACMMFMEKIAWFVPITGVNGFDAKYTRIKAIIHYGLQYNGAFWFSYAIMAMIYGVRILMKKLKEK